MKKIPLTPKDVASIEAMAGKGMSVDEIAHILGMSERTLERRMRDTPKELGVIDAVSRGRAKAKMNVSQKAYEMALGGNPAVLMFWLKCRGAWREKDEDSQSESNPVNVNIVNASLPEAQSKRETVSLLREALGLPKATKKDDPGFSGGQGNDE